MPTENIFIMENGDVLELTTETCAVVGEVPAGIIMIDNSREGTIEKSVIQDRAKLSSDGIINIVITLDQNKIIAGPDILFKGCIFGDAQQQQEITNKIKAEILKANDLKAAEKSLEKFVKAEFEALKQNPIVQILLMEVN